MVAFTGVICSLPLYPSTGGLGAADGWCLSFTVGFLWVLPLSLQCAWTWTRGIYCVLQAFQLDVAKNDFQLPPWHPTACTTICIPTRVAQLQEKWERGSLCLCVRLWQGIAYFSYPILSLHLGVSKAWLHALSCCFLYFNFFFGELVDYRSRKKINTENAPQEADWLLGC